MTSEMTNREMQVNRLNLFLIPTLLVLSAIILFTLAMSIRQGVVGSRTIEGDIGDAVFYFEFSPAYLLYPGQRVKMSWAVTGVNDIFLNDEATVGVGEVVRRIDHCTMYSWQGQTATNVEYSYSLPTPYPYVWHHPFYWLVLGVSVSMLYVAAIALRLPEKTPQALRELARLTLTRYAPMVMLGIVSFLLLLVSEVSCTTGRSYSVAAPLGIIFAGLSGGSAVLLVVGFFRPAWLSARFITRAYVIVLTLLFLTAFLVSGIESRLIVGWGTIATFAVIIILTSDKNPMASAIGRRLLALMLLGVLVVNANILVDNRDRLPQRAGNDLVDLLRPGTAFYMFMREYYREATLKINIPEDYDISRGNLQFNRFAQWARLSGWELSHEPAYFLTQQEIDSLLSQPVQEIKGINDFDYLAVIPTGPATDTVILTHIDDSRALVVSFNDLPERIQAIWQDN